MDADTGGRPAELFRFRREVLRERPAPGVGLPGARAASGRDSGAPPGASGPPDPAHPAGWNQCP